MKESIIKIWVDDEREMPKDYDVWEITVWNTIDLLETCYRHWFSVKLSLDHDAGVHAANCGDYIKILDWLEKKSNESESWKQFIENKITFHLHTANPVGRENMRRIIQKNGWREVQVSEYKRLTTKEDFNKAYDLGSKETAEKIFKMLISKLDSNQFLSGERIIMEVDVENLAKQFDVEIEEL